jgi:hypothetical protein
MLLLACLDCASFGWADLENADSARCCRFRNSQQKRASDLDPTYVGLTKLPHKGAVLHYRFCSPSQIVREGIRVLESCYGQGTGQRIVGLGKFSSGVRDLGSNKRHLKGFGR